MRLSTFGSRLRALREGKGLKQEPLAKMLNLTQSTIAYYESDTKQPTYVTLKRLADFFGVTTDYLLGRSDEVRETNAPYGKESIVWLPILGVIRAGQPLYAESNIIGHEPIGADQVKGGEFFYLRVTGDSMFNPGAGKLINDGSLVLVRKQEDVDSGDVAVVMVGDDEATVKRVYKNNGQLVLQADNTSYAPIVISKGRVKIIGKVVRTVNEVV